MTILLAFALLAAPASAAVTAKDFLMIDWVTGKSEYCDESKKLFPLEKTQVPPPPGKGPITDAAVYFDQDSCRGQLLKFLIDAHEEQGKKICKRNPRIDPLDCPLYLYDAVPPAEPLGVTARGLLIKALTLPRKTMRTRKDWIDRLVLWGRVLADMRKLFNPDIYLRTVETSPGFQFELAKAQASYAKVIAAGFQPLHVALWEELNLLSPSQTLELKSKISPEWLEGIETARLRMADYLKKTDTEVKLGEGRLDLAIGDIRVTGSRVTSDDDTVVKIVEVRKRSRQTEYQLHPLKSGTSDLQVLDAAGKRRRMVRAKVSPFRSEYTHAFLNQHLDFSPEHGSDRVYARIPPGGILALDLEFPWAGAHPGSNGNPTVIRALNLPSDANPRKLVIVGAGRGSGTILLREKGGTLRAVVEVSVADEHAETAPEKRKDTLKFTEELQVKTRSEQEYRVVEMTVRMGLPADVALGSEAVGGTAIVGAPGLLEARIDGGGKLMFKAIEPGTTRVQAWSRGGKLLWVGQVSTK
ncbi:MAG: hypothetical protein IT285_05040 [Bdellovibrionales bacterium]|nr:hypothetical protein [Bdellovibrionales bacterium]